MEISRPNIVYGAVTALSVSVGFLVGNPIVGEILRDIGLGFAGDIAKRGIDYVGDRWLTKEGLLNHDLAQALSRAILKTLNREYLIKDFKDSEFSRRLGYRLGSTELSQAEASLKAFATSFNEFFKQPQETLETTINTLAIQPHNLLKGNVEDVNDFLNQLLAEHFYGHHQELIEFVRERFAPQGVAMRFIVELRDKEQGHGAWVAYQQLVQNSILGSLTVLDQKLNLTISQHEKLHSLVLDESTLAHHLTQTLSQFDEVIAQHLTKLRRHLDGRLDTLEAKLESIQPTQTFQAPQQDRYLPRVHPFVGREDVVESIIDSLYPGKAITLWGSGGQGKTSIVWKVITELRDSGELTKRFPDGVVLYNFASEASVEVAMTHIALSLGEERKTDAFSACLRALAGRQVLLLLESTEEADPTHLSNLFILGSECGILITTRRQTDAPDKQYLHHISKLPSGDAEVLLRATVYRPQDNGEEKIAQLAEIVDSHPLALRVAANYLVESGETIANYVAWLQEDTVGALSSNDVMAKMLDRTIGQLTEDAQTILYLTTCFALSSLNENIIIDLLKWRTTEYKRARKQLLDYSLLRTVHSNSLQIAHALIYHYVRTRSVVSSKIVESLGAYYLQLFEKTDKVLQKSFELLSDETIHLIAVLRHFAKLKQWAIANKVILVATSGKESFLGKYAELEQYRVASEIGLSATQELDNIEDQAVYLERLASICFDMGGLEDSATYLEKLLNMSQKSKNLEKQLWCLRALGNIYKLLKNIKSIDYYLSAIEIMRNSEDRQGEIKLMVDLAKAYSVIEDSESFLGVFQQALEISQRNDNQRETIQLLYMLSNHYLSLKQSEKAIESSEKILKIAENLNDHHEKLKYFTHIGNIYRSINLYEKYIEYHLQAITIAEELDEKEKEINILEGLALLHFYLNEMHEAINYYERAIHLISEDDSLRKAHLLIKLSEIYNQMGSIQKSIALNKQSEYIVHTIIGKRDNIKDDDRYQNAISITPIIVHIEGQNIYNEPVYQFVKMEFRYYKATLSLIERQVALDIRRYGEVVWMGRGQIDNKTLLLIQAAHGVHSLVVTNNVEKLTLAIDRNPNQSSNYRDRAAAFINESKYDLAQADLEQAIKLNPNDSWAHSYVGDLYFKQKQYLQACDKYTHAIALNSQEARFFINRSNVWFELKKFKRVREDLEHTITLNPYGTWQYNRLGEAYLYLYDYELALEHVNHAITKSPREVEFYRTRSRIHEEQLNYGTAIMDIVKAIELSPTNAWNIEWLTCLKLMQKNYEGALSNINQAIILDSKPADFYYWRGLTHLGLGFWKKGIIDFRQSLFGETDSLNIGYGQFWLSVIDILQGDVQQAQDKWQQVHLIIKGEPNSTQFNVLRALLALFDHSDNAEKLLEEVLNQEYELFGSKPIYFRLLAHIFPDRAEIQHIHDWFEKQMVLRVTSSKNRAT